MKILLSNKNAWWNASGSNKPGFKDKADRDAKIDADYFGGQSAQNFSKLKDIVPYSWSPLQIVADMDKSTLMATKAGQSLNELLKSNYAIVQQAKELSYWHVTDIKLVASKVRVTLENDIWVNHMSFKDKIEKNVLVEREHRDRFVIDGSGTALDYDYGESSPVHFDEKMEGFTAGVIKKKTLLRPFDILDVDMGLSQITFFGLKGDHTSDWKTDHMTFGETRLWLDGLDSEILTEDGLKKFYQMVGRYTMSKSKWLRSYINITKESETDKEQDSVNIFGVAKIPYQILTAPVTTSALQPHRVQMDNHGAEELYKKYYSDPNNLGFQLISYPSIQTIAQIKSGVDEKAGVNADKMTMSVYVFFENKVKPLMEWLRGNISDDEVMEEYKSLVHFYWMDQTEHGPGSFFQGETGDISIGNYTSIEVSKIYAKDLPLGLVGKKDQPVRSDFEPKLNCLPFASYSFSSSYNVGGNFEPNLFYNESEVGVRSVTSLSPENSVQRLLLGKIRSTGTGYTFDYNIGAYRETNLSSLGAHWSNPFYPPVADDAWKEYVNTHKSSVISGALTQVTGDIGKFGMSLLGGAALGGGVGSVAGAIGGVGSAIESETNFWSHRADMKRTPQKINQGGMEWTVAAAMDTSAYIKSMGLTTTEEAIVNTYLNANGYISGLWKPVNLRSRKRYNYIKINSGLNQGIFPGESVAPSVIDKIAELLQGGVRIWHYGAEGQVMDYSTENWESKLKEVA